MIGSILLNRYRVDAFIAAGGMGAVYRARDMHFPKVVKDVAVKEMINRASDPVIRSTIVQTFEREANLLAALDHRPFERLQPRPARILQVHHARRPRGAIGAPG